MTTPIRSLILTTALVLVAGWQADVIPQKLRTSGARQSLDAWSQARAWPDSFVPDEGHFRGVLEAEAMPPLSIAAFGAPGSLKPTSHGSEPKWRSLGPLNIGGRTLSVTLNPLNPQTVYAGSAGGGLWVSRTGGIGVNAWQRVVTGFPVTSASCLTIAPNDTSVMYLGTGEVYAWQNALGGLIGRGTRGSYGFGILKSTDAGHTWSMSLDWSRDQKRGIWAIRIDPEEPNRVWAATTEGIYRSIDAGATWNLSLNVVMGTDIELDFQNPDTAYAACGNFNSPGYGIYRTFNGGANWTKLGGGLPTVYGGKAQIVVSSVFTNVLYAGVGGIGAVPSGTTILRSFDHGTTWTTRSAIVDYSSYQYWYSHDIAIQPDNFENVWVCGIDVWKSTTSGTSPVRVSDWQLAFFGAVPIGGPEGPAAYVHADIHAITFHPTLTSTIYYATDGGVFRTTNGGTSFESCNGGYATSQFYPGFAVAAADTVPALGGMQDNFSAIYEGGPAWNRVIGGDGCWAAIDPNNSFNMWGSYQLLNILRSFDKGANWGSVVPPGSGSTTAFVAPYVLSPFSSTTLYAGRAIVYRTTNGGTNWVAGGVISGRALISMSASATLSGRILVGCEPDLSGNAVWLSDNEGVSWTNISAGLPNRYPLDVVVAPNDAATLYVTFGGYDISHVWKSTNGGASWQSIGDNLPDLPTWALAVDPLHPTHLYVGNDLGVFASPDGGITWGSFREGLPEAVLVSDLVVTPGPRRLRVVTHGNGVFDRPLPELITGVADQGGRARPPSLIAWPNPFAGRVQIRLADDAPRSEELNLVIVNVAGRLVRQLAVTDHAGTTTWDGNDDSGREVADGVYWARMAGPSRVPVIRLVRQR